jgi:DNA-binding transcriptional MocR family regulator
MKKDTGRVENVMRQIETALLDGTYPAHARLPAERVLAESYGVSRNTVREAIQRLAARGPPGRRGLCDGAIAHGDRYGVALGAVDCRPPWCAQ